MDKRKIKILEPNKGKHIAIVGDINTILASKEDIGGTYSFIEAKVFPSFFLSTFCRAPEDLKKKE